MHLYLMKDFKEKVDIISWREPCVSHQIWSLGNKSFLYGRQHRGTGCGLLWLYGSRSVTIVTRHDPAKDVLKDELSDCIVDWIRCVVMKLDDRGDSDRVSWALATHRAVGLDSGRVVLSCSGRQKSVIRSNLRQQQGSISKWIFCNNTRYSKIWF